MTNAVASFMPAALAVPAENGDCQAPRVYRLRKSFAVVHFEPAGKGRIVFLPEGAELTVVGASRLRECREVRCENQLYNIFEADLLGPWSASVGSRRTAPGRAKAMGGGA
jgi:hypothetical protein